VNRCPRHAEKIYNPGEQDLAVDQQLLLTFGVTLFSIIDSIGNVPFFVAATEGFTQESRRWIIERAILIASAILIVFLLSGRFILNVLHLRLSSFEIAAGIVLFMIGWDLLRARSSAVKTSKAEEAEAMSKEDIAVFPLGIPLLAGPGAITTCIVYGTRAESMVGRAGLLGILACVMVASFLVLLTGATLMEKIGLTGMRVIRRVIGLLLTAIAVNFVVDGIRNTLPYLTTT